ncbi:MAG: LodA/GoxA family CTQ-dependent oxidase [Proteobacteria bacterium]|nr:LodA/GoxA family CTQ-dependent oxidase [Pseudomonadota bacterium]
MRTIYSIHPAIGIARVGNSKAIGEEGYFIGPEAIGFEFEPQAYDGSGGGQGRPSGQPRQPGEGSYRDRSDDIRRQGARFRVYEKKIDNSGNVESVREITSKEATITWHVSLANKKAAADRFPPYYADQINPPSLRRRNHTIKKLKDRDKKLVIKATGKITKGNARQKLEDKFMTTTKVKLGDLLTDKDGRLIVLGGEGRAESPINAPFDVPGLAEHQIYNNDGWFDDTSDGSVTAFLKFKGQKSFEVDEPAWVIVGPPDHAPAVQNPVTLYDVVLEANLNHRPQIRDPAEVKFTLDIYPILRRAVDLQHVSKNALMGHSGDLPGNFLHPDRIKELSSNAKAYRTKREDFLNELTPYGSPGPAYKMPRVKGGVDPQKPDRKPPPRGEFGAPLTFTSYQFGLLERWVKGDFIADGQGPASPGTLAAISADEQLDRAALEACVGGSFHPGIEASYRLARADTYDSWFRLAKKILPGDLTKEMAVPWQTDFSGCSKYWWPGQRPNWVKVGSGGQRAYWDRGTTYDLCWDEWSELGFVKRDPTTGEVFEDERNTLPKPP